MCGWLREVSQVYRIVLSFVHFFSPQFCFTNRLTHPIVSARGQCFPSKLVTRGQSSQKNRPDCWSRLGQKCCLSQLSRSWMQMAERSSWSTWPEPWHTRFSGLIKDWTFLCLLCHAQRNPRRSKHRFNTIPGFKHSGGSVLLWGWMGHCQGSGIANWIKVKRYIQ